MNMRTEHTRGAAQALSMAVFAPVSAVQHNSPTHGPPTHGASIHGTLIHDALIHGTPFTIRRPPPMIFRRNSPDIRTLKSNAYAAFERGELAAAREAFDTLLERVPDDANYRYMQGLVCKYLRDWPRSLAHNR